MNAERASGPVLWRVDERGVARVTLNRPEVYNAYNGEMIEALLSAYDDLAGRALRAVVITGEGRISRPAPTSTGSTRCGADRRRRICAPRA